MIFSTIIETRTFLSKHLFAIDPIAQQIFIDFNRKYSHLKLVDILTLESQMPLTISEFKKKTIDQFNSNKAFLIENWIKECTELIVSKQDSIESLVTKKTKVILIIRNEFNLF